MQLATQIFELGPYFFTNRFYVAVTLKMIIKITGKDLTPYLLKEISLLSKGSTQKANVSLILNNAKVAGKIAKKLSKYLW